MLQQSPSGHRRVSMFSCQFSATFADAQETRYQRVQPLTHLQHQCSVNRVLAGRSEVDELPPLIADLGGKHPYKWNCERTGRRCLFVQGSDIE